MAASPSRAIIGVGNVLLGDEGVGVHVARWLLARPVPPGVLVLDGGTEGLGLMDVVAGLDRLVVVDCVRAGHEPGTIYRFGWRQAGRATSPRGSSLHRMSVEDVLHHVGLVARVPSTIIVGVEPASLGLSLELSDTVAAHVARLGSLAIEQVMLAK